MDNRTGLEIAVIGMAGRFPGAKNIAEFWENLKNGVESISFFCDEELEKAGVSPQLYENHNYVRAKGIMADSEYFDSSFFSFTPVEASLMDPQLRICLQCAYEALEVAGYNARDYDGAVGFYTGASTNLLWQIQPFLSARNSISDQFGKTQLSNKDFLGMRTAYSLNLKGPAISISAACSTSLVAVDMACRALLTGQCDMALAGGVTLTVPLTAGYLYEEGMVMSGDGHVRAFDASASGTNGGDGVGIVVLKPLEDAAADRDYIYAVIKGSEVNNDGNRKVGFQAPSVAGQAEVISKALHISEVEPESIGYIETHGTGTPLGDPVEIEALIQAFDTDKKQFCLVGSVKSNVGHLDSAAGITGFIKAVLALKHKQIPPSIHFENRNPKIDFEKSPFYVNTKLTEWKTDPLPPPHNQGPRRAGVSSLGIGGSNAHVILEEYKSEIRISKQETSSNDKNSNDQNGGFGSPVSNFEHSDFKFVSNFGFRNSDLEQRQYRLILFSARSESALEKMTVNLVNHFKENPAIDIKDAAYTLQVGRQAFEHRRMLVCSTAAEAAAALSNPGSGKVHSHVCRVSKRPVIFMFAGQGSQYVNMGLDLYNSEPLFRREMDHCFKILQSLLDYDIKEILYPHPPTPFAGAPPGKDSSAEDKPANDKFTGIVESPLNQPLIAQVVVFIFEYALAKLLMAWGIQPYAVIGYSFGEYPAACIAGIFSVKDALKLIVGRGELVNNLPPGRMVSVPLNSAELKPLLNNEPGISIAIDNGPSCIVSGAVEAIDDFTVRLKEKRLLAMPVNISHALHSEMMEPVVAEFETLVRQVPLNTPVIPIISGLTGSWAVNRDITDPAYWIKHMRSSVKFAAGLQELLKENDAVFLEIGPGGDLSTILRQLPGKNAALPVLNTVRYPQQEISDHSYLSNRLGRLWLYGAEINWQAYNSVETKSRIPLPTYPFEGMLYPLDVAHARENLAKSQTGLSIATGKEVKRDNISDWFYLPQWKVSLLPLETGMDNEKKLNWLLLGEESALVSGLGQKLEQKGHSVTRVYTGMKFSKKKESEFMINPGAEKDYLLLLDDLASMGGVPDRIVHLWSLAFGLGAELLFNSLIFLVRAIGRHILANTGQDKKIQIFVVSNNMQGLTGDVFLDPEKALLLGPVRTIPKEYPDISCRSIDFAFNENAPVEQEEEQIILHLSRELMSEAVDPIVAYRGHYRLVQDVEPLPLEKPQTPALRLKQKGVYLITGGLGGIGLTLAEYLVRTVQARLILVGRSAFPSRKDREKWLAEHETPGTEDPISVKIRKLIEFEKSGAEILVFSADVSESRQMKRVIDEAEAKFGTINGIIHAAGVAQGGLIGQITPQQVADAFKAKVYGTLVLDQLFKVKDKEKILDFFILCSSLTSLMGAVGEVTYCAANAFLDAFALSKAAVDGMFTTSINWDAWQEVGFAVAVEKRIAAEFKGAVKHPVSPFKHGILPAEGVEVFKRVLAVSTPRLVVSTVDLAAKLAESAVPLFTGNLDTLKKMKESGPVYPRPALSIPYTPPGSDTEQLLCETWENFLGIEAVGIHDNFFELGATSLAIVQVTNILKGILEKDIPVAAMYAFPTVQQLARYLGGEVDGTGAIPEEPERSDLVSRGKNKLKQRKRKLQELSHARNGD